LTERSGDLFIRKLLLTGSTCLERRGF